jgi:predicted Zn finger-like uncharacterized protein
MSLATRCPTCATAFRVVQDQLKVSEGWVRCGRCDAVFNALEGLFDLGRDAPADWDDPIVSLLAPRPPEPLVLAPADPEEEEEAAGDDDAPASNLGELLADPIDAHLFGPRKKAEAAPKPAGQIGARDRVEFSDARFDSDLFSENASVPDTELIVAPVTDPAALPLESSGRPDFVRRADRRARWQTGPARAALAAAAAVALGALALQVGHHYRDSFAAQSPALRGPLLAWCQLAGCKLEAPRRIDDIQVESTALVTRAPAQEGFVLSITLRNRGALTLGLPSIDLTLTDANGRLVARRALAPRDFRAAETIAPGAEASLQTVLSTGTAPVVGYTVEIFYP